MNQTTMMLELTGLDDLLMRTATIFEYERPRKRNQQGVRAFIQNDRMLLPQDREYIDHVDDLLTLGGDLEHSWVHGLISDICTKVSRRWSKVGNMA